MARHQKVLGPPLHSLFPSVTPPHPRNPLRLYKDSATDTGVLFFDTQDYYIALL